MKLDFGSPKPPRREELEEQASIDFVFIPPETKERLLTEHQKEVKRTKRSVSGKSAIFIEPESPLTFLKDFILFSGNLI